MKRLLFAGLLALALACTAKPAHADCSFEFSCTRHLSFVHTSKNRCFSYSSHSNPLPCAPSCGGYGGPALWDGYHPSAAPAYGVPAYAAAPVAAAPAAAKPSFTGPQPTPAPKGSASPTGLQQAGYFYYPPASNAGYNYGAGYGYGYGYGYGAGYSQAPSYWYGD